MGEVFKLNHCYNMDCLPAMELFPDNYFDLAVVDPPYFSGPERRGFYGSKVSKIGVHRDYPVSPAWSKPEPEYGQCRCCWTLWSKRLMTGTMKSGTGIERWERPMDEATRISLKDQFNSLLVRAIEGRRGGMALMRVLEELDFYNSPASAKHHLNVPGGLVLHSLNVARTALELCDKMPQFAKCNKGAVLTAALLHDVCKAGQYIKKPDGSYCYEDSHLMGHGEASVSIIKDWIFLTDTEALAIRWHMGAYSGEQDWGTLSKVYDRCPEALCLHMADMIATHIMEVEE